MGHTGFRVYGLGVRILRWDVILLMSCFRGIARLFCPEHIFTKASGRAVWGTIAAVPTMLAVCLNLHYIITYMLGRLALVVKFRSTCFAEKVVACRGNFFEPPP